MVYSKKSGLKLATVEYTKVPQFSSSYWVNINLFSQSQTEKFLIQMGELECEQAFTGEM